VPLQSSYAARPEYGVALDADRRPTGRTRTALLGNDSPRLLNACPNGISNFVDRVRSLRSTGSAEHAATSTLNEAIAPTTVAARGQKRPSMKSPKTVGRAVAVSLVAAFVAALALRFRKRPIALALDAERGPLPRHFQQGDAKALSYLKLSLHS
jgi:hypothetical protein